jgi:hypothetical protein
VSLLCQGFGADAPSRTARHKRNRRTSYAASCFVLRRMSPQKSWNGLLKVSNLLDLKIRRKAGTNAVDERRVFMVVNPETVHPSMGISRPPEFSMTSYLKATRLCH